MILTIDTDKESPDRLRQIARFLETLASGSVSEQTHQPEQAEDFSFSEDAFSAVFDTPEPEHKPRPSERDDDDDFRVMPY